MMKGGNVIGIMQNTLDCVDPRLMNHGKRVAYLVFQVVKSQGKYTEKEVRDICILALLHDIGAYKTEEIDKMIVFEIVNVWAHSIYGYLFLKYFSPLHALAPVICFHHADCHELQHAPEAYRELAQIISLCDRIDMFAQTFHGDMDALKQSIERFRDVKFRGDIMDLVFAADIDLAALEGDLDSDAEFFHALYDIPLSEQEISDYIKMIILSIEFRSHQTALHTIAATCTARTIAELMRLDADMVSQIVAGAMLHDIGKTGIPLEILEKPGRLDTSEMETMKSHVELSERIIDGNVEERIKRIAVRHHEKLDGSGYHKGVRAEDMTVPERILAIADIFSALCGVRSYKGAFSKEKTVTILEDMCARGFIDSDITRFSIAHFEFIMEQLEQESAPVIEIYDKINKEYEQLLSRVAKKNVDFGDLFE